MCLPWQVYFLLIIPLLSYLLGATSMEIEFTWQIVQRNATSDSFTPLFPLSLVYFIDWIWWAQEPRRKVISFLSYLTTFSLHSPPLQSIYLPIPLINDNDFQYYYVFGKYPCENYLAIWGLGMLWVHAWNTPETDSVLSLHGKHCYIEPWRCWSMTWGDSAPRITQ